MISIKELRRSFGPIVAVDGISFDVRKGEVLGFLGPNGAGKSTVMRMLACYLRPTAAQRRFAATTFSKTPSKSGNQSVIWPRMFPLTTK